MKNQHTKSQKKFEWSDLYLLIFLTPLIINPWGFSYFELPKVSYFTIFLSLSSLTWLIWTITQKKSTGRTLQWNKNVMIIAGLWLVNLIISTIFSIAPERSLWGSYERVQGLFTLIAYLAHWFLLQQYLTTEKRFEKVLSVIFWVSVVAAAYSLCQKMNIYLFAGEPNPAYRGRVFSTTGQPNFLGQFLLFPIWINCYFFQKKFYPKYLLIGTAIILLGSFVLTENRASWLALLLSVGVFIAHEQKFKKWKYLILSSLLGFFALFVIFIAPTTRSLQTRFYLWQSLVQLAPKSVVMGSGLETITLIYPTVHNPEIARYESINSLADNAHNMPLEIMLTQGLFGLLILIAVCYGVWKIFSSKDPKIHEKKFLYVTLIAFFITYFFSFPATSDALMLYTVLALMVSQINKTAELKTGIKVFITASCLLIAAHFAYDGSMLIRGDMALSNAIEGFSKQNISKTTKSFAEALKINPHQSTISTLAGLTYQNLPENSSSELFSSTALDLFKQSLAFNGGQYYQDYANLAQWLVTQKRYDEAQKYLLAAQQIAPQVPLIPFLQGKFTAQAGDVKSAIIYFEKFFSLIPDTWKKIDAKDFATKEEYRIYMKTNPLVLEGLQTIAELYKQNGDSQKAEYYEKYIP